MIVKRKKSMLAIVLLAFLLSTILASCSYTGVKNEAPTTKEKQEEAAVDTKKSAPQSIMNAKDILNSDEFYKQCIDLYPGRKDGLTIEEAKEAVYIQPSDTLINDKRVVFLKSKSPVRAGPLMSIKPFYIASKPRKCSILQEIVIDFPDGRHDYDRSWYMVDLGSKGKGWVYSDDLQKIPGGRFFYGLRETSSNSGLSMEEPTEYGFYSIKFLKDYNDLYNYPNKDKLGITLQKGTEYFVTATSDVDTNNIIEFWCKLELPEKGYAWVNATAPSNSMTLIPAYLATDIGYNKVTSPKNYEYEIRAIAANKNMSYTEKKKKLEVYEQNLGEQVFTTIVRNVPVYNSDEKKFETFDSFARGFVKESGCNPNSDFGKDPVGTTVKIFMDDNISANDIINELGFGTP